MEWVNEPTEVYEESFMPCFCDSLCIGFIS